MTTRRAALAAVVILAVAAPVAPARPVRWAPTGPLPGAALAGNAQLVAPGADGLLFLPRNVSRDGGRTWQTGPRLGPGVSLGASRASAGTVYAVGPSKVLLSRDGGRTWQPRTPAGTDVQLGSDPEVSVDPRDADVVCVSASQDPREAPGPGLRSTDAGATFTPVPMCAATDSLLPGPVPGGPSDVAQLSAAPVPQFALAPVVLRRSHDGGMTFSDTPTDLPVDASGYHLVDDPARPGSMYAIRAGFGQAVLYHTLDGAHWVRLQVPHSTGRLLVDPTRQGVLVADAGNHVWRSTDDAVTWTRSRAPLPGPLAGFDGSGALYVLGGSATVSTDDGMSWTWRGATGLSGAVAGRVAVDQSSGSVYSASTSGLQRLDPAHGTWRVVSPFGQDPFTPQSLAVTPEAIVYRMGAGSWIRATHGRPFADAASPDSNDGPLSVGGSNTLVALPFVSRDAGRTWQQRRVPAAVPSGATDLTAVASGGGLHRPAILFLSRDTGVLYRSDDLAGHWHRLRVVHGAGSMLGATARALYVRPAYGVLAVPLVASGRVRPGLRGLDVIAVDVTPTHPSLAVAVVGPDGSKPARLYVTTDAGRTWKQLVNPAPPGCVVAGTAVTPQGRLVVLLDGGGPAHGFTSCRHGALISSSLAAARRAG